MVGPREKVRKKREEERKKREEKDGEREREVSVTEVEHEFIQPLIRRRVRRNPHRFQRERERLEK